MEPVITYLQERNGQKAIAHHNSELSRMWPSQ